jgi:hypothetical protein
MVSCRIDQTTLRDECGRDPPFRIATVPLHSKIMIFARPLLCCVLLLGSALPAVALIDHVAREQDIGTLRLGQRVLVDDGTCQGGMIKEVSGSKLTAGGIVLSRKCVPRSGPKTK